MSYVPINTVFDLRVVKEALLLAVVNDEGVQQFFLCGAPF